MTVAINEFSEASKHQQRVNDRPAPATPVPRPIRWTVDVSNADMTRELRHLADGTAPAHTGDGAARTARDKPHRVPLPDGDVTGTDDKF